LKNVVNMPASEVFEAFETSANGLTKEEAAKRLEKYGPNMLIEKKGTPVTYKFLGHLKDLFSVLLLFASLLAAIGGAWQNDQGMWELSFIILVVVLINTFFSLFQEWRAEKAMETLKSWMPEYAKVIREGELQKVPVRELVPGDIIELEEGDRVPADGRLFEAFELWTNNVPLTGESEPQPRTSKAEKFEDSNYLDAPNLVLMSTSVARGQGRAVVIKTGMGTKFGEIAGLTQEVQEEPSPLQKEIAYTARYDFILAITVGTIFFGASLIWLKLSVIGAILFMIGVMVALVPEGLQVTVSSALAINVLNMVKENVLVKKLSAVQTLGSVTVICTDKTGTITKGEMTARKVWVNDTVVEISGAGYAPEGAFTMDGKAIEKDGSHAIEKLLEISALCNSAKVEPPSDRHRSWDVVGDPTDGALVVAAMKYGLNVQGMHAEKPIIDIVPFDSRRKRMTTMHKEGHKILVYTKGAPRSILSICDRVAVNSRTRVLEGEQLRLVEDKIREFAGEGLRVVAIAYKELAEEEWPRGRNVEKNMILVGLAAMRDPARPEVKEAVRLAKEAGIKTVIITGDYGPTAQAIASEVGIVYEGNCRIMRGVDLETKSDREIVEEVRRGDIIFARVSPEQKLRIVKTLKENGEVVAVTGDGANDAPSLREADIGVAMGASGTDVAREASDMILLDDSFASIVKAVESGRAIYENLRKFIIYVFSHNWAELVPYVLYATLGLPLPLLVAQVLAIDLAIDVIPSLALSREPVEQGIMQEPPRSVKERIFSGGVFLRSLYVGLIISTGAMYGCLTAWSQGGWHIGMPVDEFTKTMAYQTGVTMTFAGIVVAQVGNVFACRTHKVSLFETGLRSNKWIWLGVLAQISILSALIYMPFLQPFFGTTAIGPLQWAYLALLACIVILAEEIRKWFARRLNK
jgi:Ca2+-transporting ATPase